METSGVAGSTLDYLDIRNKQSKEPKSNELGQTAFLELMITQLSNQDPLSPQDNGEFIAQLAQFSSVEGIERLNTNFESFSGNFTSNRALQASALVGRSVTVPSDSSILFENSLVSGVSTLPATTTDMTINVYDSAGSLVDTINAGFQKAGDINFQWDGQNVAINGEIFTRHNAPAQALPAGEYTFEVTATQDGKIEELDTALSANVNSVTVEPSGNIVLNLAGIGPVNLSEVKQFN